MELRQFNITYSLRSAIKGQALADFLVECSIPETEVLPESSSHVSSFLPRFWELFVDGSLTADYNGAGILLISPEKFEIQ